MHSWRINLPEKVGPAHSICRVKWIMTAGRLPVLDSRANDHPLSGWLGVPAVGRKNKNTSVFQSLMVVTGGIAPGYNQ